MYSNIVMRKICSVCIVLLILFSSAFAQTKKYSSLLWEITGNGLRKPSYLFGTMHVSSKMVFHLSDSFYYAIKNVDEVALEQNPLYWQRDMMRIGDEEKKITGYMRNGANNYITEKSFQLDKYEDDIRAALTDEPQVVNSLLYRNYQAQEDYEENTYLDLYIYQTGRKLGKKAAGVEDYYQTERIVFEAYQDALNDKNKKERNTNGESMYDIEKKIQNAYRQGDLDLLDSLEKFEYASAAFLEKFLYKRNEIQAASIDTILKHNSLFVGVGAAHLPGKRGVIELLRRKGYHLRPVQMQDRNADRKDDIDKIKVPVVFRHAQTADGFISMQLPGTLYKRGNAGNRSNESWQYADMENGTYYTIIRVQTEAALLGQTIKDQQYKTDSLLYENIPGKIIKKSVLQKDGFPVIDITNRTRRGDLQRYNIIITPFEEIICKMSGNEDYVSGAEADTFFNSIHIQNHPQQSVLYASNSAGFRAQFPQMPQRFVTGGNNDNIETTEWEAVDTTTGNAYIVWKKTVNNYGFIEEDTFDLSLIEESIKRSDLIDKETSRNFTTLNGYASLNMKFILKNGSLLQAKAVLRGAHYYVIMATSDKKNEAAATSFLRSFSLADFTYPQAELYKDTTLHFTVQTPVAPVLDTFLLNMIKQSMDSRYYQNLPSYNSYRNINRTAFFQSDSTGEAVLVSSTVYPKYYYSKDSASFWKNELYLDQYKDFIVRSKETYKIVNSCSGYKIVLQDTNTVRQITVLALLKKNQLFRITALGDTVGKQSAFLQNFFSTFQPDDNSKGEPVFTNKQNTFFADYKSKDSATHNMASDAAANVYFTCQALPQLQKLISSFTYGDKNYFENKNKFIHELGFINDSDCAGNTEKFLSQLYRKTADTAFFQNEILLALARLKTKASYDSLQAFLLQDPPVFDDDDDYDNLFELLQDSLQLTRRMFPDILQLSSIESYKKPVNNLLVNLIDSGLIKAADYDSYFSRIYFDAKIEMKKMQNNDERLLQKEDDAEDTQAKRILTSSYHLPMYKISTGNDDLSTYSTLLMPFYQTKTSVASFFEKLLSSKNPSIRLDAAIAMTKNKMTVPDSTWMNLASNDKYRVLLLKNLKDIHRKDLFPKKEANQEAIAKSVLLNDKGEEKFQTIQLVNKRYVKAAKDSGFVYFFQYKTGKDDDDWKIGISGLQPANSKEVSDNNKLVSMTEKTITNNEPAIKQFENELKELLFSQHESAYHFFIDKQYYDYRENMSFGN